MRRAGRGAVDGRGRFFLTAPPGDGAGGRIACCTAVAVRELALARVLAASLRRIHPDWPLIVLVLDGDPAAWADEPFEAVGLGELDRPCPGLLELLARGPRVLAAALRPALMARLVERGGGPVVWLDATVRVLAPLDALAAAADGIALVPLQPRIELDAGFDVRGPFEAGLVAAGDVAMLNAWERLLLAAAARTGARFDPRAAGLLGGLAAASGSVRIVRDRALCAGWWTIAAGGRLDGEPLDLDGARLGAFDFAGFDPRRPHWLSDEDPGGRARASSSPTLVRLLADQAHDLLAAGWVADLDRWRYAELAEGLSVDDDLRDLFAQAVREGVDLGDPFSPAGRDALLDWADGESALGAGVTRYLERVHRRRADLLVAFPDLAGGDGGRLARWMADHGAAEEPVLGLLLERRRERDRAAGPNRVPRLDAATAAPDVDLFGYLEDGLGLGQAARCYVHALRAAGVDVATTSLPAPMSWRAGRRRTRHRVEWGASATATGRAPVEIVCMNPPELLRAHAAGMARRPRTHRIGVWAWELDTIPAEWTPAFELVDEVWAYSEHVAAALRTAAPATVPIVVAPLAIDVPAVAPVERPATHEPFGFLFVFDLLSSVERKNPLGLIDAFGRAFRPGEGPRLVLKASNGDSAPDQLERIRVAAIDRPDVEIAEEFLSPGGAEDLISSCDCYVSLHRAEGFGLTLAEAMALGRPTIATGYSGNLDFMTSETAYLVDWSATDVGPGSELYPSGARWAEPDLDDAARLMRCVYVDPDAAQVRGAAGREHVRELLAPAIVGERLRDRVERAAARTVSGPRAGIRTALARRRGA